MENWARTFDLDYLDLKYTLKLLTFETEFTNTSRIFSGRRNREAKIRLIILSKSEQNLTEYVSYGERWVILNPFRTGKQR